LVSRKLNLLKKAWDGVVQPLVRRTYRKQVAAVCYKGKGKNRKVLVITSRETKRWIIPKGWPIDGLGPDAAAAQEAWEEAGVKPAVVKPDSIGTYDYDKRLKNGDIVPCATQVFAIEVSKLEDEFPEVDERTRKWVDSDEAAELVDEPGLKAILEKF